MPPQASALTARIDAQDTGVGLSPDDAQHVFDRFFRADPARSSSTEGAGLGLSLVQWIAAQPHGAVTVQSRLGEGSTFAVTCRRPIADTSRALTLARADVRLTSQAARRPEAQFIH